MLIIIFIVVLLYLGLIGSFIYGFDKVSSLIFNTDLSPKTKFTVIVPFRNEAEHLPELLTSVAQLKYPKHLFEIILVNDDSTDDSILCINRLLSSTKFNSVRKNIRIIDNIRQTNAPKKDAISTAIEQAQFDWIVTTDADCQVPNYWLDTLDTYIQQYDCNMLVAPVTLEKASTFFERFQLLETLSLQGATIGGFGIKQPFMCNGANLIYRASIFKIVDGYSGNTHIASGDDMFLLEKFLKHDASKVKYVKHEQAIVTTRPETNFKSLKSQRVRWAAKTTSYKNTFGKLTGILILLMNALLVGLPLLSVLQVVALKTMFYVFAIKWLIDFLLVFKSSRFFGQETFLGSYMFSCLIYPFFSVYIAFIAMFKGYKWKDRAYHK